MKNLSLCPWEQVKAKLLKKLTSQVTTQYQNEIA